MGRHVIDFYSTRQYDSKLCLVPNITEYSFLNAGVFRLKKTTSFFQSDFHNSEDG